MRVELCEYDWISAVVIDNTVLWIGVHQCPTNADIDKMWTTVSTFLRNRSDDADEEYRSSGPDEMKRTCRTGKTTTTTSSHSEHGAHHHHHHRHLELHIELTRPLESLAPQTMMHMLRVMMTARHLPIERVLLSSRDTTDVHKMKVVNTILAKLMPRVNVHVA